jgi:hypothetical protein
MSVEWSEAPEYVLDIAQRIIGRYHEDLKTARIAFIMRSVAPVANGTVTYGKAKKVSAELRVHIPYDFIIWLAKDEWALLSPTQREALIDHECSHCSWDGLLASLKGHDVEEFSHIIQRYGFWWPQSHGFAAAVQKALPLAPQPTGGVGTLDFGRMAQGLEQGLRAEGFDVEVTHVPAAVAPGQA